MRLRSTIQHLRPDRNLSLPLLNGSYKYEPLPSPSCIRLLELAPGSDKGIIRCWLKTFELQNAPSFRALSYTWGTSRVQLSPSKKVQPTIAGGPPRHNIICGGHAVKVTSNLRDALRMLSNAFTLAQMPKTPSYYWIDALCMNQADIPERNDQVARMAHIFEKAAGVVIWLGKDDEFTLDALHTMSVVSKIPETDWPQIPYTSFYDTDGCENTKPPRLTYYNWLGFMVLINRPWFKRAWVVQEIAFAKSAIVVCGNRTFDWNMLSKTLSFIKATKFYHHLHTEKLKNLKVLRGKPGIYKRVLESRLSVGLSPIYLNETRAATVNSGNSSYTGKNKAPSLRMLLDKHRFSQSSDPRDKVYAFLGLANKAMSPFRSHPAALTPDYNLSVQQVYTEAAQVLITTSKNLSLLSHVEDASSRSIQGMPSWVPDLSVSIDPYPLRYRGPVHWSAAGKHCWTPNPRRMSEGLLDVQGYFLDYVDGTSILPHESPDPSASWASIVKLALSLNLPYPVRTNTPPSRLEVLWRTLTTDVYAHTHPAPSAVGSLFLDYILNLQIRHRLMPWSSQDTFQPHHSPLSDSIYPDWRTLLSLEPADSPYSATKYKERLLSVVEKMFDGTYSPIELAQLQHELDQSGGRKRRLFKTHAGYLGTGPRSLQPGDEIWILHRGELPFVLRPQSNGYYRLVGESFVYGVMHGEALESCQTPSSVTLE